MTAVDAMRPGPKPAPKMTVDQGASGWRPRMPPNMPDHARRLWRQVVPILADSKTLTPLDGAGLESMCLAYHVMKMAAAELAEAGGTHEDDRGIVRKHPAFQVWRDSQATFRSWAGEFGLTPLARKSIPAAAADKRPDLAEFLRIASEG